MNANCKAPWVISNMGSETRRSMCKKGRGEKGKMNKSMNSCVFPLILLTLSVV
jgi:hypothetical protein